MDNDISPQGYSSPLANFEPQIPNDRKIAEQKERDETLSQLPLLKTVLTHLDRRIAETDSVKHARQLADKYKLTSDQALAIQTIMNELITKERSFIDNRIVRASKKG